MKQTPFSRICALCLLMTLLCPLLAACIKDEPTVTSPLPPPPDKGTQEESLYDTLIANLVKMPAVTVFTEIDYRITDDRPYRYWYSSTEVYTDMYTENMFSVIESVSYAEIGSGGPQLCSATDKTEIERAYRLREGYAEGHMFRSTVWDGLTSTAKTAMPYTTYCDLVGSCYYANLLGHFDPEGCETAHRRKLDNGFWELTYVGLSEENLTFLADRYLPDLSYVADGIFLTSAEITVTATPQFTFDSIRMELKLSRFNESGAYVRSYPTMTVNVTFAEGAALTPADIDLSEYEDIGDLRMPAFFEYGLDGRKEASRGQYTYSNEESFSRGDETAFQKQSRTYNFNYTSDGKLTYRMTSCYESHEETWNTVETYGNGKLLLKETNPATGETNEHEIPMTPEEVLWDMTASMTVPDYSLIDITEIETLDGKAGQYRFHLGLWMEKSYADAYAAEGDTLTDFTAYLDVTLYNGDLNEYTYHLEFAAKSSEGEETHFQQEIRWIFDKTALPVQP